MLDEKYEAKPSNQDEDREFLKLLQQADAFVGYLLMAKILTFNQSITKKKLLAQCISKDATLLIAGLLDGSFQSSIKKYPTDRRAKLKVLSESKKSAPLPPSLRNLLSQNKGLKKIFGKYPPKKQERIRAALRKCFVNSIQKASEENCTNEMDVLKLMFLLHLKLADGIRANEFFQTMRQSALNSLQFFLLENNIIPYSEYQKVLTLHSQVWERLQQHWLAESTRISTTYYLKPGAIFALVLFSSIVLFAWHKIGILQDPLTLATSANVSELLIFFATCLPIYILLKKITWRASLSSQKAEAVREEFAAKNVLLSDELTVILKLEELKTNKSKSAREGIDFYYTLYTPGLSHKHQPESKQFTVPEKSDSKTIFQFFRPLMRQKIAGRIGDNPTEQKYPADTKSIMVDFSQELGFSARHHPLDLSESTLFPINAPTTNQIYVCLHSDLQNDKRMSAELWKKFQNAIRHPHFIRTEGEQGIECLSSKDGIYEIKLLGKQGDLRLVGCVKTVKGSSVIVFTEITNHAGLQKTIHKLSKQIDENAMPSSSYPRRPAGFQG